MIGTMDKQTMTFKEAREMLTRHYRIIGVLADLKIGIGDKLIAVGGNCNKGHSSVEASVVREVSLEQDIGRVENALAKLSDEYRNIIDLRFNKEFVIRRVAKIIYRSISTTHALERAALTAFIVNLGKVPLGR